MGLSGVSVWEIMLILLVVLLLFGTKKLRGIGSDLGTAIRDFRRAMSSEPPRTGEDHAPKADPETMEDQTTQAPEQAATSARVRHPVDQSAGKGASSR